MNERAKMNALRSGVVVLGSLAFGYLTIQLKLKPFLENAQQEQAVDQNAPSYQDGDGDGSDIAAVRLDDSPKDIVFSDRTT